MKSQIDLYVEEALRAYSLNMPTDSTYHPLYKAWKLFCNNPRALKEVSDKAAFGNGMMIFLSYGTISNVDIRQQISSIAYLFLSLAITECPTNMNLYKNRALLLLCNQDDFYYTVSSVVNANESMMSMLVSYQFTARDSLMKMMYSDLCAHPAIATFQLLGKEKKELDSKIISGFFGENKSAIEIKAEGSKLHKDVLAYLQNKVLDEEDVNF